MAAGPLVIFLCMEPTRDRSAGHYVPGRNAAGRWEEAQTESIIALLVMVIGLAVAALAPQCSEWEVEWLGGIAVGSLCRYEQREELGDRAAETLESTPPPLI